MLSAENFDRDGFSKRLRELQGALSDRAFAAKVGISPTSLNNYVNGQTPGVDKVVGIAAACGVSVSWLITGGDLVIALNTDEAESETVSVPVLDIRASAGAGTSGDSGQAVAVMSFPRALLRSTGTSPSSARILTVAGDSMEPTLTSGDLLLVDASVTKIKGAALYVLVRDEEVYVKRAERRLNGSVLITSDNPRYVPEEFSEDDVERLLVAGRVVWFGRAI